jgi:hypothetical protein
MSCGQIVVLPDCVPGQAADGRRFDRSAGGSMDVSQEVSVEGPGKVGGHEDGMTVSFVEREEKHAGLVHVASVA